MGNSVQTVGNRRKQYRKRRLIRQVLTEYRWTIPPSRAGKRTILFQNLVHCADAAVLLFPNRTLSDVEIQKIQ